MRLVNPIFLAALTSCVLATEPKSAAPNPNILIDSIAAINTAVLSLTEHLKEYKGGINASVPVTKAILFIHSINREGYAAAQTAAKLNETASQHLVDYTNASVGKSIPIAVNITKAKKHEFDGAELSTLVEASLKLLLNDHETFSGAVGQKLAEKSLRAGLKAEQKIAFAIQGGINYYANSTAE